jgi:hypothetical protein
MPDEVLDVYPDILCLKCRNLDDGSYEHPACPAFPDGIPANIILGGAAHFKVARGQEGDTVFAPKAWAGMGASVQRKRGGISSASGARPETGLFSKNP